MILEQDGAHRPGFLVLTTVKFVVVQSSLLVAYR